MANSGNTTTDALTDSIDSIISAARIVREFEGVMPQLVDKVTLGDGVGLTWNEVSYAQITATAVTETTDLNNPQQLSDTLFSLTPTVVGIHTIITDRVAKRLNKAAFAKTGALAQNAIQRKKDEDGLIVLDGATTSLSGAGTTLTSGTIAAAAVRITSNATTPGIPPLRGVLHGFQIKDFYDEVTGGLGTYPIPEGETARVFKEGFKGQIASVGIFEDGNITIDSSSDSKGGVFAKEAIVMVQGRTLRTETERKPNLGGGATAMWMYDEYIYGERSAG
ncbi:MAG: hypothetical protein Q7J84_02010, partial [Sulfuricaulis sp.]|nr:hypothetical protein [Sulfuricaulis sp.]